MCFRLDRVHLTNDLVYLHYYYVFEWLKVIVYIYYTESDFCFKGVGYRLSVWRAHQHLFFVFMFD